MKRNVFAGILAAMLFCIPACSNGAVEVRKELRMIPSYGVAEADRNPYFYNGRAYQGAQGPVYPYPLWDKLTNLKAEKEYEVLVLENEYIEITVIPELGGRLFSARDKTNGYDFFYRQHVIKPALIGCLGAWISGGVEWNVPHHHRSSSLLPVDYQLREHPDGSKSIVVGETERRHRLKWSVELTLYPGKSYIESSARIENTSPLIHTFLYWANVAVHADSSYQVIFPPSVQMITFHGKNDFSTFPIGSGLYRGIDYAGIDMSWWKNHPKPISLFAHECKEDFVAGYNHDKEAGVVHWADHHVMPGKKLWEWGPGKEAQMWDDILSDEDGPYIEIMVGAYSDNQPDYSWIRPGEVKSFKHYWYPLRETGGVKNANLDASCNLDIDGKTAEFAFNTSAAHENAVAELQLEGKLLFSQTIAIAPDKPFKAGAAIPEGFDKTKLTLSLRDNDGKVLVSFSPPVLEKPADPVPVTPFAEPEEFTSVDRLYNAGNRLDQFYNAALEPDPYFEEVIKRDSLDYRSNTALGIIRLKDADYTGAEKLLRKAVKRAEGKYTRPRNGEAYYYLGEALKYQGRLDEAYDYFYRAFWSSEFQEPASLAMAEIAGQKGDMARALSHAEKAESLDENGRQARFIRSLILERNGDAEGALKATEKNLAIDPLDLNSSYRKWLLLKNIGREAEAEEFLANLESRLGNKIQAVLEVSSAFANAGFYDGAATVLETAIEDKSSKNYALVLYNLGYTRARAGDEQKATAAYAAAAAALRDFVFPFRPETLAALEKALEYNPQDASACYYLGNLLYDHQPGKAIEYWERSSSLDGGNAVLHRNLALAYSRIKGDYPNAVLSMEQALKLEPSDPRYYMELDILYEKVGKPLQLRLENMEDNEEVVSGRVDALSRLIGLLVTSGNFDKAISLLENNQFNVWEGGGEIHNVWVDAHLMRGRTKVMHGQYDSAIEDFKDALLYPRNLEVGKPMSGGRSAEVFFHLADVLDRMGDSEQAESYYTRAADNIHSPSELSYYQGEALKKIGRDREAMEVFDKLIARGESIRKSAGKDFFAKFGEGRSADKIAADGHYLCALGLLGKGRMQEAEEQFRKILDLDRYHRCRILFDQVLE